MSKGAVLYLKKMEILFHSGQMKRTITLTYLFLIGLITFVGFAHEVKAAPSAESVKLEFCLEGCQKLTPKSDQVLACGKSCYDEICGFGQVISIDQCLPICLNSGCKTFPEPERAQKVCEGRCLFYQNYLKNRPAL